MCGITGIAGKTIQLDEKIISDMIDGIRTERPEVTILKKFDSGFVAQIKPSVDNREQFFVSPDNSFIWAVNGRIYNHQELRKHLKDYPFQENSDCEVVGPLILKLGIKKACNLFDGQFSFVCLDLKQKKLYLGTDSFGVNPILYCYCRGNLVFASRHSSILASKLKNFVIDPQGIAEMMVYRAVPFSFTGIKDVFYLPQGHYAIFDIEKGTLKIEKYYELKITPPEIFDIKIASKELRNLLAQAVRKMLIPKERIVTLLSGGIDSSSIYAFALKENWSPYSISCFFGKKIDMHEQELDGLKEIQALLNMYKQIGNHQFLEIRPEFSIRDFANIVYANDHLSAVPTVFSYYTLLRFAGQLGFRVALTGEGLDELLAGYLDYPRIFQEASSIKDPLDYFLNLPMQSPFRSMFSPDELSQLMKIPVRLDNSRIPAWIIEEVKQATENGAHPFQIILFLERAIRARDYIFLFEHNIATYHPECLPIERRMPALDKKLVEFTIKLHPSLLYNRKDGLTKYVLREAMKEILPREVLISPKRPFTTPIWHPHWINALLKYWGWLLEESDDLISMEYVRQIRNRILFLINNKDARKEVRWNTYKIFGVMFYKLWRKQLNL